MSNCHTLKHHACKIPCAALSKSLKEDPPLNGTAHHLWRNRQVGLWRNRQVGITWWQLNMAWSTVSTSSPHLGHSAFGMSTPLSSNLLRTGILLRSTLQASIHTFFGSNRDQKVCSFTIRWSCSFSSRKARINLTEKQPSIPPFQRHLSLLYWWSRATCSLLLKSLNSAATLPRTCWIPVYTSRKDIDDTKENLLQGSDHLLLTASALRILRQA